MRLSLVLKISVLLFFAGSCKEADDKKETMLKEDTVVAVPSPAGQNTSLPFLVSNGEKTMMSWVATENDSLHILKYTQFTDEVWQSSKEIIRGTDWFVNWADFPTLVENSGNLWSHVLKKSTADTYSYDVKMNLLPKGDSVWKTNIDLHTDGTPTEHGFVTALPYKQNFFVTWLDGRHTEENKIGERGAMTIRAAQVTSNGQVSDEHELDLRTCDCCQTTAAITQNGPVVIYRDRSDEEVRDISIVRQVDGIWTTPKPVHEDHWNIKGCPVNGPKAAAIKNGVAVAWFTAAQDNPRVQVAFSKNGGAVFNTPIQIATGNVLGRVDLLLLDEQTAIVSWMQSKDKITSLQAVKVAIDGTLGKSITITPMNGSRKSGFPQMERVNERVFFAWTHIENDSSSIKVASVNLDVF